MATEEMGSVGAGKIGAVVTLIRLGGPDEASVPIDGNDGASGATGETIAVGKDAIGAKLGADGRRRAMGKSVFGTTTGASAKGIDGEFDSMGVSTAGASVTDGTTGDSVLEGVIVEIGAGATGCKGTVSGIAEGTKVSSGALDGVAVVLVLLGMSVGTNTPISVGVAVLADMAGAEVITGLSGIASGATAGAVDIDGSLGAVVSRGIKVSAGDNVSCTPAGLKPDA